MNKYKVQQIALWIMLANFPFLYLSAITFENPALVIASLCIMIIDSFIVSIVY